MTDLTFKDKNNQKKTLSVFASGEIDLAGDADIKLFTAPEGSVITNVYGVVLSGSGDTEDKLSITLGIPGEVGTSIIGSDLPVDTTGVYGCTVAPTYTPVYNGIYINPQTVIDTCTVRIVVEYTELDLGSGTFTD